MAQSNSFIAPEFNQNAIVQKWLTKYQQGDFYSELARHWRDFVLVVFQHLDDPAKEERQAEKYLFHPLETFLCNGRNPDEVFQELKEKNQPSQLCGHVFKTGEPTYSCRECATDPTCVLCMECFQTSIHKQHRYRMSTSGGGGYCDCGDAEAWKTGVFCGTHQPKDNIADESKPEELLPEDLTDRAAALFLSCLRYTVEMLTWKEVDSLPDRLTPDGAFPETCVCMLFNDEVHTYEQVITTLQKAVHCTHKQAVDYATTVDREGRSPVKTGLFSECDKAKQLIKRATSPHGAKPLKVQVMRTAVVAHQQFALRMIQWLQTIIGKSDGLRRLLCLLSMQQQETERSFMEVLLLADTQLWKIARIQIHQLMMAGVLMDQECKRKFSIIFTKHYTDLMKAFCLDDHDHDVSIASLSVQIFTVISLCYSSLTEAFILDDHNRTASVTKVSVQIFTVPTLARLLVSEHNLLSVILQTFLQACEEKKKDGKLSFDRAGTQIFKRACFSLYDLKYALICKPAPSEWTPSLRQSFLNGFSKFLDLLKLIEGMDKVKRQIDQHLEFEPEWEGAFNLQLKLDDNIVLFQEWCCSDREVLVRAYNLTLETVIASKAVDKKKTETVTIGSHSVKCIKYDVSSQPISIHLPVIRLLSGLHTCLSQNGITFESPDADLCKPDAVEMMELPLRVQVMVAQANANMWRRNGYALNNQIYFYHNVKFRAEMYDRDIVMLQVGAATLEPNSFIIHVLYKFGLHLWAREDYDQHISMNDDLQRQIVLLAEEFLDLLIIVIGERHILGVGQVSKHDIVKREVIHQLCITPMTHSELAKGLPEDPNHETGLEEVAKDVATFKKVTAGKTGQGGKGKYVLNDECYQYYNPYFYHYTKGDKSKSEDTQVKRRKEQNESQALPPPVPIHFTEPFKPIIQLLQSDVMAHIIHRVLSRAMIARCKFWSETQLERVLHLILLAAHEQKRAIESGDHSFDFLSKACTVKGGTSIMSLLESAVGSQNISHDSLKDLLSYTVKMLNDVRQMKNEPVAMDTTEQTSTPRDEKADAARKQRAVAAEKRRQKILAHMSKLQKIFIQDNEELFKNTSTELVPRVETDMDLSTYPSSTFHVAVGPKRTVVTSNTPIVGTCILCQEEQEVGLANKAMVLTAFIQKSTVMSRCHGNALLHGEEHDPLLMRSELTTGSHTSSCGHMMHADCWQRYFDAILLRERRRPVRFRPNFSYDIEKNEFLCPLCECISNTVIPVLPPLHQALPDNPAEVAVSLAFQDWLDAIHITVINSIKEADDLDATEENVVYHPYPMKSVLTKLKEGVASNFQALWTTRQEEVPTATGGDFSQEIREMLKKFSRDAYTFGLGVDPDDDNQRVPIMVWNTCAFTLQSMEQILRDECKPLFGQVSSHKNDCIKSLVKGAAVYSQLTYPEVAKEHCIRLLSFLLPNCVKGKKEDKLCLLDVDMFHYLTCLIMSLPMLHQDTSGATCKYAVSFGGISDHHALHLVMAVHLMQVLLAFEHQHTGMEVEEVDYEGEALLIIYDKLHSLAHLQKSQSPLPTQLSLYVRQAMLPFLRCAALLFHNLSGVTAPTRLTEAGASLTEEYEDLCRYLGAHTHMSKLLDNQGELMDNLINKWCKNPRLQEVLIERTGASSQPALNYPLSVNKLITLPDDYSELINKVSTFTCPKSDGDDSRAPTMCLVCGQMLCSQSYCCQTEFEGATMGAATEHAYKCGAGTGIFLRVRECQILLLAGRTKGCFVPPPYVDDYGETDQGLRRGNPLHLDRDSYEHLQKLWMQHAIPETIAHNLESNPNLLTIDWQHL